MNITRVANYRFQLARVAFLAAVGVAGMAAQGAPEARAVSLSQMAGSWTASLIGQTGCGLTSLYVTFTLNSTGTGTATIYGHSAGCGNSTTGSQQFTIQSFGGGLGTASLSCGSACGWNFTIQVAPNVQVFNLVDITDPNNFLAGDAVRK